MKDILTKIIEFLKPQPLPDFTQIDTNVDDEDAIVKSLILYPYFIYSNKENKMIGEIMLSEDQANALNKSMKGYSSPQDISFVRM